MSVLSSSGTVVTTTPHTVTSVTVPTTTPESTVTETSTTGRHLNRRLHVALLADLSFCLAVILTANSDTLFQLWFANENAVLISFLFSSEAVVTTTPHTVTSVTVPTTTPESTVTETSTTGLHYKRWLLGALLADLSYCLAVIITAHSDTLYQLWLANENDVLVSVLFCSGTVVTTTPHTVTSVTVPTTTPESTVTETLTTGRHF